MSSVLIMSFRSNNQKILDQRYGGNFRNESAKSAANSNDGLWWKIPAGIGAAVGLGVLGYYGLKGMQKPAEEIVTKTNKFGNVLSYATTPLYTGGQNALVNYKAGQGGASLFSHLSAADKLKLPGYAQFM